MSIHCASISNKDQHKTREKPVWKDVVQGLQGNGLLTRNLAILIALLTLHSFCLGKYAFFVFSGRFFSILFWALKAAVWSRQALLRALLLALLLDIVQMV